VVRVTYDLQDNERRAGAFIGRKLAEILKAMGATRTWPGLPAGLPIPINSHAWGGTRMGDDPTKSVVNEFCISHEVSNLAVLGGSCFVSTTGYNPTETIEALSWRAAEHIAAHFSTLAV
jgi:gluconate 2-dehydrogenase alpha chain